VILNGADVFGSYAGESEETLRRTFGQAAAAAEADGERPCILFIDELDALTPNREGSRLHETRVVAQLLTLMDGIQARGSLVVIGATNRPNAIDPALRRPGRFDREIAIDMPGQSARQRILEHRAGSMPLAHDVDLRALAESTNGYAGADLASLCLEAAVVAVESRERVMLHREPRVAMADFKMAMAKMQPAKRRAAGSAVTVEPGSVKWSDVGGLELVKKRERRVAWVPELTNVDIDSDGLTSLSARAAGDRNSGRPSSGR
ncbi:MAG: P-loop containing nucleoside triphosphate hydrolase protein, partial [Olpidium bornovanus]